MKYDVLCFIILINLNQFYSIIVIPFQVSDLFREENLKETYSINDYFSDFFQVDYYSSIEIGKNDKKILTRISFEDNIFFLSEEECKRKSIEKAENYAVITRTKYKLDESSSYKNITIFDNSLINFQNGGIISETFSFFNTTKLKCHPLSIKDYQDKEIDSKIKLDEFKIIIENFTQNGYCAVIGVGKPNKNSNYINFINELKKNDIISDYSFTYQFITSSSGQLIIGALPHEYYNSKLFQEFQFIKMNSYSNNDNLPWPLQFNKIFIEKRGDSIIKKKC